MARLAPLTLLFVLAGVAQATPVIVEKDYSESFGDFQGCFVRSRLGRGAIEIFGEEQCRKALAPCSTFKVPNSLIGLETGVIPDADHVIAWDGVERDRKALNRDRDLRSAIRHSVVWYFQELARRVGMERMQEHVSKIGYGNEDLSGGLTEFWLASSLEITAHDQIDFLQRLQDSTLPFSERSMAIVREIMILEETDGTTLRGKTGSCRGRDGTPAHGWFVGYVTRGGGVDFFATNIEGEGAWGPEARRITLKILKESEVIPPE